MSSTAPKSKIHTYVGRLNWLTYAVNETFIIVFPDGFDKEAPVQAYHQWTVTADKPGKPKVNHNSNGLINESVPSPDGSLDIQFHNDPAHFYKFKATVSADRKALNGTMWKDADGGASTPIKMLLHYSE